MNIFAFVGTSGAGKTFLVEKLVRELMSRGYSVAAVKHAAHGFSLDEKEKDSWKFTRAGAQGTMVLSREKLFLQQKRSSRENIAHVIRRYYNQMDCVLLEGGKSESEIPKIEILKKDVAEKPQPGILRRIAMAADFELRASVPVFNTGRISQIADFLEENMVMDKRATRVEIDGIDITLNDFVRKMFSATLQAMVSNLSGIPREPETIEFFYRFGRPAELRVNRDSVSMNQFVRGCFTRVIKGMISCLDGVPQEPKKIEIKAGGPFRSPSK